MDVQVCDKKAIISSQLIKKIQAKFDFDMLTLSVLEFTMDVIILDCKSIWIYFTIKYNDIHSPLIMPIDTGFQVLRFLLTNSHNTQIKFEFGYYPFNGSRVMLLSLF